MEEITKTDKTYSLAFSIENFKELKKVSQIFKDGKKNIKNIQIEAQTRIEIIEKKIKELKEEQSKIEKMYKLHKKQEEDNSNIRLANFMWLVKNLSFNNVISNNDMCNLLSNKTGENYEFKVDIHYSGSVTNSNIWGELKLLNKGKEIVLTKKEEHASSIEMCYCMKDLVKKQLENKNWFINWTMRKNGITEKDLEKNGIYCDYTLAFCKSEKNLDTLMFETVDEYIMGKINNKEEQE